jgi:xylulokinase
MNHPTTAGLYMFMLCYKNGSLAREHVRDTLNKDAGVEDHNSWDLFNKTALEDPALGQRTEDGPFKIGLFFPRPEIVPNVHAGEWHYDYYPKKQELTESADVSSELELAKQDAREIIESQFLSLRLRSSGLVHKIGDLPPQPRRVYLVGGGSVNPAIAQLAGEVLGGAEGVFRLDIGGNACALGAAYKACWAVERKQGEKFEDMVASRWNEAEFVKKVDQGYRKGVFEKYGEAVKGFGEMEEVVKRNTKAAAGSEHADAAENALKSSRG